MRPVAQRLRAEGSRLRPLCKDGLGTVLVRLWWSSLDQTGVLQSSLGWVGSLMSLLFGWDRTLSLLVLIDWIQSRPGGGFSSSLRQLASTELQVRALGFLRLRCLFAVLASSLHLGATSQPLEY